MEDGSERKNVKLVAQELHDPILFGLLGGFGLVWFVTKPVTSIYKTGNFT